MRYKINYPVSQLGIYIHNHKILNYKFARYKIRNKESYRIRGRDVCNNWGFYGRSNYVVEKREFFIKMVESNPAKFICKFWSHRNGEHIWNMARVIRHG